MPIVLSLTQRDDALWALGPEGLYEYSDGELAPLPQPDAQPACCLSVGDRLLVGGATHGVAYAGSDGAWQASWMDGVQASVVCMAADPDQAHSGVVLAGSSGGGILRTTNRGRHWSVCNFGLFNFDVLCMAWAPLQPAGQWPPLQAVFAGTEGGVYRSPNGGRGWKQSAGLNAPVISLAVAPDFHDGGAVLAGTEGAGLWRSEDGGFTFAAVPGAPEVVNALAAWDGGWLLSDAEGIWRSDDGAIWSRLEGIGPAFTLFPTPDGLLAGGMDGVFWVDKR